MNKYRNLYIYSLVIILCTLIIYISFSVTALVQKNNKSSIVSVSTITGERLRSSLAGKGSKEVTYAITDSTQALSGISNADIVYEYMDVNGKIYYKALFHDKIPEKSYPVIKINNVNEKDLPKLNFIDDIDFSSDYTKPGKTIFVNLSYNIFSNFICEDNKYVHYRESLKDIDKVTSKSVSVSNIIIQFTNDNDIDPSKVEGSGKGLLFCGGKVMDIKWDKEKKNPIKLTDDLGNPVNLLRGHTWWLILKDSIALTYD